MAEAPDGIQRIVDAAGLVDEPVARTVLAHEQVYEGAVWSVRKDTVDLGVAGVVTRDVVVHPGAVAVLAQNDDGDVLILQQYRHPVSALMWEIPAGLRDDSDVSAIATGQRELAEETGFAADRWMPLIEYRTTPGGSSEQLTIVHAVGLHRRHVDRLIERTDEERDMPLAFVPVSVLLDAVLAGQLANPCLVVGVLALAAQQSRA